MQANLGYLFYHGIYDISPNEIKSKPNEVKDFLGTKIENTPVSIGNQHFSLYTTYPGLMTGVGMAHGVKDDNNDFKIGFYFDHTTGLPHISGSSVKGVLRSIFPCLDKNHESQLVKFKWLHALIKGCKEDADFLKKDYAPFEGITLEQKKEIAKIEYEIFNGVILGEIENDVFNGKMEGENISIYKRDIFHDAVINRTQTKFLGTDYITPHLEPLKNPTPIQFLKILPNIEFVFHFQLQDGILSAKQKKLLFQKILLTIGIGAKTNVGYGQFSEKPMTVNGSVGEVKKTDEAADIPIVPEKPPKNVPQHKIRNYTDYAVGEHIVIVEAIEDGYVYFKKGKDVLVKSKAAIDKKWQELADKRKSKNKPCEYKEIQEGMSMKIDVKKTFDIIEQVFAVLPIWKE